MSYKCALTGLRNFSISMSRRPKIIVTDNLVKVPRLSQIGDVLQHSKNGKMEHEILLQEITDADAIFCLVRDKIDREVLDRAKNLKVVSTMSVGYEHIDIGECRRRGICIGYTPDVLTEATAELGIALLLATSRRIPEAISVAKTGEFTWNPFFMCGKEIYNSTIGIYGMGKIGKSIAEKLLTFHPKQILYCNRRIRTDVREEKVSFVSFSQLLSKSDFLLICAPSTEENRGIFNATAFKAMKNDSILINISRGALINHSDLLQALQSKEIGAAGLDVTEPEPLPANSPLFQLPNCVILPHIGSATMETRQRMVDTAEANIINFLTGKPMVAELK